MTPIPRVLLIALTISMSLSVGAYGQRFMERLDRGVVATHQGTDGVFVSWRLLGNEPADLAFNVYRQVGDDEPVKLNAEPLTGPTHYTDSEAELAGETTYFVRPVANGVEGDPSRGFSLAPGAGDQPYLSIPLQTPDGYHANDASVGDLDGDGQYEVVVHMVGRGRDNSQSGLTTEPILHAYQLQGDLMWSINLGKNVREGAHYTQFMVYDLDGDGKAEVVCKTADGTTDGVGQVIGDPNADHRQQPPQQENRADSRAGDDARDGERDQDRQRRRRRWRGRRGRRGGARFGYVLKGPEFLTVFNGQTGAAMATVDYVPLRHPETHSPTPQQMDEVWGDGYGNRIDRFLACVAYLDGERPSVVMCRGYYTRTVLAAWDWRDGELRRRWVFDSDTAHAEGVWSGQGNHSVAVADVDDDGKDEIVYGSMVVDDDGTGLYSTGLGHGDAQHTTDIDPRRPGLEIWSIHENPRPRRPGVELRNARTGEVYFEAAHGVDVGRGMAADIDPRHPGYEMWGGTDYLFNAQGEDIGARPRSQNMAIWWDGDLLRELLDGVTIYRWDYADGRQVKLFDGRERGLAANNGSKSNPCLSADILGDWREEIIARTRDSRELRVYTTTMPTPHRMYTLMHDPTYRLAIAWQNVAYNQPPHPGFFLGAGMEPPPRPDIRLTGQESTSDDSE